MRKNKIFKIMAAVFSVAFILSGMTAFAFSAESEGTATTETVIEDNRTLTPKGNADLLDDVSDSEDLQFITVTTRDGNVFYFVIDHAAENENVYFLNVVDESDLEALAEESEEKTEEIHNPFGSTNCIRFLGYNLSHRVAPLCLYGGKVSEKETEKH